MINLRPEELPQIFGRHINAMVVMPMVLDTRESQEAGSMTKLQGNSISISLDSSPVVKLGMNHPKLTSDAESFDRITDAAVNKVANSDIDTAHMARLLETFSQVSQSDALPYAFHISGGTLAVENKLKVAFDWKVGKIMLTEFLQNLDRRSCTCGSI
ncbi:MAG: hypothetical protein OXE59_01090 [Bacteroidetes bacterium]|nr:hypothetical protein [Bacteroidota bacterium]MCY4232331.1 hypothetical protein [Bacteroidota bacterium]